jgi:hypothetical protein
MERHDDSDDTPDYAANISFALKKSQAAIAADARAARERQSELEAQTSIQRRALRIQILSLLTTAAIVLIYLAQLGALREEIGAMREQVQLALDAQRPWFLPLDASGVLNQTPGQPFATPVEWMNSGDSPALDVAMTCGTITLPATETFRPDATGETPESESRTIVGPKQTIPLPCSSAGLQEDEIREIQAGTRKFYIFGKATYRDSARRNHHTTFCLWLKPDPQGGPQALPISCATYNDAD